MNGVYYVIRNVETKKSRGPSGVSQAPHLYSTAGKAGGIVKQLYPRGAYEVVPVQLTVITEGTPS